MRVIAVRHIREFCQRHPTAAAALQAWLQEAKKATWETPQHIRDRYSSASFVGGNRVVFNLKGNEFRLIVAVAFRFQAVYIKFIGTHTEYDEVDALTVEMN